MTNEEFEIRWKKMIPMQKKFVLKYIECFDPREAAIFAGYSGVCIQNPIYRILRKVQDVTDYLIAKQNIYSQLVKKEWIVEQIKKIYQNSSNPQTKLKALEQLSKILQIQEDQKIEITNNIPQTPVVIQFQQKK